MILPLKVLKLWKSIFVIVSAMQIMDDMCADSNMGES